MTENEINIKKNEQDFKVLVQDLYTAGQGCNAKLLSDINASDIRTIEGKCHNLKTFIERNQINIGEPELNKLKTLYTDSGSLLMVKNAIDRNVSEDIEKVKSYNQNLQTHIEEVIQFTQKLKLILIIVEAVVVLAPFG